MELIADLGGTRVMNDDKIYAGIVSYNPDIQRISENIFAIHKQVPEVIIFDNGSNNINHLKKLVNNFDNVHLLESSKNIGIAAALNSLMSWGLEHNYLWMLSLDQDSVCSNEFVEKMKPYLSVESNLGIVAPVIVDRNVGIVGHNPTSNYAHVKTCITSGCFSNIEAWRVIDGYDESMFIDSVDFDFCYRIRKKGYGVIQVKNVQLLHELGNSKMRKFIFWSIDVTSHSAFRKYYIAKNNVYYPYKNHLWFHFIRGNLRNIWLIMIVLLYESDKNNKIHAIIKGWKDAYKRR